jgi:chromosome segregation ATPase
MDTLNAFEALAEKVERIVEKYETAVREKEILQQQLTAQKSEHDELARKVDDFSNERTAVRQRIDAILHKIEELGI